MAAVIANEFSEATEEIYLQSLIEVGLVLFVLTFVVLACSRMLIAQLAKGEGKKT